jgi:hypothetical protein
LSKDAVFLNNSLDDTIVLVCAASTGLAGFVV